MKYLRVFTGVLLLGTIFFSCENDIGEVDNLSTKGIHTESAINIESYLSVGGKTKARLTSPLMTTTEKDSTTMIFPKSLHVIFYDDSTGLPATFLYAKYGIYYQNSRKVLLKDSVIGTNIEGDTLRTTEMWWNQNTQEIYGSKPTRMVRISPYNLIKSDSGFRSRQDFSDYVFYNTNKGIAEFDSTLNFN